MNQPSWFRKLLFHMEAMKSMDLGRGAIDHLAEMESILREYLESLGLRSAFNPIFYIDFYKVGHISQYRDGVTQVWSNWTARSSRVKGQNKVVVFGLTYLVKKYFIQEFQDNFFDRPLQEVLDEYRMVITETLGNPNPRTDHIEALHTLGYLPISIHALPEGAMAPLNVPQMVITNTRPEFYWLPNYFETLLSLILWKPSTSATTARRFREICLKWARKAGETDFGFIDWQCHDFSMRGMSGLEDAILSGMGHLLSFSGTDTIPAILAAKQYYGAALSSGGSVNATEHSVMCSGEKDHECETIHRLLTQVHPTGILSIVSDTWDLWQVLTSHIPALKDVILNRDGKLVVRPDSGHPTKIICGNPEFEGMNHQYDCDEHPAALGTMRLLARALGVDSARAGLPLIRKGAAIYGDSIDEERADEIFAGIVDDIQLSPYNMVYGVGSFTYEYKTRDTYGYAMKATAIRVGGAGQGGRVAGGEIIPIWKKPVTDSGGKFSHRGILAVYPDPVKGYRTLEDATEQQMEDCAFGQVFVDSELLIDPRFRDIRQNVRAGL